jgi:methionyl-tRNA synthetase
MINKYFDGKVPDYTGNVTEFDAVLKETAEKVCADYQNEMENMQFSSALSHVWVLISRANKYIDETAPWKLAKEADKTAELSSVMVHLAETLRISAILLQPFLTHAPKEIFTQLGVEGEFAGSWSTVQFGLFPANTTVIKKGTPIFPRLDIDVEVAYIKEQMAGTSDEPTQEAEAEETEWDPSETTLVSTKEKQIKYEDFDKVELKVAEVIDCQKVEGADKLLKFRLDAGDEGHRQILSGIAEWYPDPEALIGKKVMIVANLKPRKMRGEVSQGMILSAEKDGKLQIIEAPLEAPNGSEIA